MDLVREGFPEEVKPGGILGRGRRLGQRPRGGEGLLGRGVAWWEHGTVPQRVKHGLWIPENIPGCLGMSPLLPKPPRCLRSPELSWNPNQPQSRSFHHQHPYPEKVDSPRVPWRGGSLLGHLPLGRPRAPHQSGPAPQALAT